MAAATLGLVGCMAADAERDREAAVATLEAERQRLDALEEREAARVEAEIARIRGESQAVVWEAVGRVERAEAELRAADERLAAAKESDDLLWGLSETAVGVAAGFFPPLAVGGALIPVLRRRSKQSGAQTVIESVAVLRRDPTLNAAFEKLDPTVKELSHKVLDALPDAAKALDAARRARASQPTGAAT